MGNDGISGLGLEFDPSNAQPTQQPEALPEAVDPNSNNQRIAEAIREKNHKKALQALSS